MVLRYSQGQSPQIKSHSCFVSVYLYCSIIIVPLCLRYLHGPYHYCAQVPPSLKDVYSYHSTVMAVLLLHLGGRKPGHKTIKVWIKARKHLTSTDSHSIETSKQNCESRPKQSAHHPLLSDGAGNSSQFSPPSRCLSFP